jgi:hypothetical protein
MRDRLRFLAILIAGLVAANARGESFHFTVTADPRGNHEAFGQVLTAIRAKTGGPGAFHVSLGDIDNRPDQNRAQIDLFFGRDFLWFPGIGNHEAEDADVNFLRDEYHNGNHRRTFLKQATLTNGPPGSVETTYSWNYGKAHFVMLNEYWNGGTQPGDDTKTDGDVVPALRAWLADDLAAHAGRSTFVFGHEPAFPFHNHEGNSLDKYSTNRDAFWQLLESRHVLAYFCGHTHVFSKHQPTPGQTWQIDVGNAGNDNHKDGYTFVNVIVSKDRVRFDIWRDPAKSGHFTKSPESFTVPVPANP